MDYNRGRSPFRERKRSPFGERSTSPLWERRGSPLWERRPSPLPLGERRGSPLPLGERRTQFSERGRNHFGNFNRPPVERFRSDANPFSWRAPNFNGTRGKRPFAGPFHANRFPRPRQPFWPPPLPLMSPPDNRDFTEDSFESKEGVSTTNFEGPSFRSPPSDPLNEAINKVKEKLRERRLSDVPTREREDGPSLPADLVDVEAAVASQKTTQKKRIEHSKSTSPKSVHRKKFAKAGVAAAAVAKNKETRIKRRPSTMTPEKMRKTILQQLFKLNNTKLRQVLSQPESSAKYDFALNTLLKDTRKVLSNELRSVAERSLEFHNVSADSARGKKIVSDAFLEHLETMLDTSASVELFSMEPKIIKELGRILQNDLMDASNDDASIQSLAEVIQGNFSNEWEAIESGDDFESVGYEDVKFDAEVKPFHENEAVSKSQSNEIESVENADKNVDSVEVEDVNFDFGENSSIQAVADEIEGLLQKDSAEKTDENFDFIKIDDIFNSDQSSINVDVKTLHEADASAQLSFHESENKSIASTIQPLIKVVSISSLMDLNKPSISSHGDLDIDSCKVERSIANTSDSVKPQMPEMEQSNIVPTNSILPKLTKPEVAVETIPSPAIHPLSLRCRINLKPVKRKNAATQTCINYTSNGTQYELKDIPNELISTPTERHYDGQNNKGRVLERMKEIDENIQILLQEKFKLYNVMNETNCTTISKKKKCKNNKKKRCAENYSPKVESNSELNTSPTIESSENSKETYFNNKFYSLSTTGELIVHQNIALPFNTTLALDRLDANCNKTDSKNVESQKYRELIEKYAKDPRFQPKVVLSDCMLQLNPANPASNTHEKNIAPISLLGHKDAILAIRNAGAKILAVSQDGNVYIYISASGKLINSIECSDQPLTCLFIKLKSNLAYCGSLDSHMYIVDHEQSLLVSKVDTGNPIQSLTIAWNMVFVGTRSGSIVQYDLKTSQIKDQITFSNLPIFDICPTKEGPRKILLIASRSSNVMVKDANSGLLLRELEGCNTTVYSILLRDNYVYCGTSENNINVFDFVTGKMVNTYISGKGNISLHLSNNLLLAGCYDGVIYAFKLGISKPFASIQSIGKMLLTMKINKNKTITSAYKDKSLVTWPIPKIISQEMKANS